MQHEKYGIVHHYEIAEKFSESAHFGISMQRIRFSMNLSADEYLHFYRGQAKAVSILADDGRRIEIPAASFRKFVTQDGVTGRFEMLLDSNNKLLRIERISPDN